MISKRLMASYVFDWLCIVIIAAIGGGFYSVDTYQRPFSLVDLDISFPFKDEQIPVWLLVVVALFIPAGIIFVVCLVFVPGRWASRSQPRKLVWSRKLWEWNTSWMGLGLSLALAFMVSQGMKNVFGKPRPNLLARCQPDVANYQQHVVSRRDFAGEFNPAWVLVGPSICQNPDNSVVMEGFRSFPSAHASFSWAGLLYLSFFLASKFAVGVPFAPTRNANDPTDDPVLPVHRRKSTDLSWGLNSIPYRNRAAAPPVYLVALPLVPICGAIYITASRFFDFYHDGWDLLFGSLIGIISSWFAFRWYHMPISSGAGWSWGPRSRDRAFVIGVGRGGYVGDEGWGVAKRSATTTHTDADGVGVHDKHEGSSPVFDRRANGATGHDEGPVVPEQTNTGYGSGYATPPQHPTQPREQYATAI